MESKGTPPSAVAVESEQEPKKVELEIKEWEVGMYLNEVVGSQGIRIREGRGAGCRREKGGRGCAGLGEVEDGFFFNLKKKIHVDPLMTRGAHSLST